VDFGSSFFGLAYMTSLFFFISNKSILPAKNAFYAFFFISKNAFTRIFF